MAPPQVNLNEKPPAEPSMDPLPEKKDGEKKAEPVIITVDRRRLGLSAEERQKRKRCRIACCASLSFLLVLLLALGTTCLVYRSRHRRHHMGYKCGTKEGHMLSEQVEVDHDKQLIYVRPKHPTTKALEMLHEYNRRLIAFKNSTEKVCYLDRLDETFQDGYARFEGYEEKVYKMNHTLRVFPEKINIEVVKHVADVHIFEHCGKEEFEYHWVMEVTEEEIREHPTYEYITV